VAAVAAIVRTAFVPAHFYVGEEAEAWVQVTIDGGDPVAFELKPGAGLPPQPAGSNPEIRGLSLVRTAEGWEFRFRFIAWTPGSGRIPSMELRGISVPAIGFEVDSVLGPDDREPSAPKPQLDPPGTGLYLYGFASLVIFLALLIFASAAWLVPAARRLLEKRRAAEARRNLAKTLAWLGKGLGETSPKDFYAVLARSLRLYLAERVLPEAPALTPFELGACAEGRFPVPGLRDDAAALLAESDAVRYAGQAVDEALMRHALERAARIGDAAEEALNARV
jgi:hypothetical protein